MDKCVLSGSQNVRLSKICYLTKLLMMTDCIYSLNSVNMGFLMECRPIAVPLRVIETP